MKMWKHAVFAATAAMFAGAAPIDDEVTTLPGWKGYDFPSKWYSGFVDISDEMDRDMAVHYAFVESENDPSKDPVILWSNGGPGASSMYGLLVELGPLRVFPHGYHYPTTFVKNDGVGGAMDVDLFYNPHSWTKVGSVLVFDWPPPIGFSYCDSDPTGDGYSCGDWDDDRMQKASFAALRKWFDTKFPELKNNEFFLTGESYAGVYIPKLAQAVLQDNKNVRPSDPLNLRGVAIGDPCAGTDVMCGKELSVNEGWWYLNFLYGHGQISIKTYESVLSLCQIDLSSSAPLKITEECKSAMIKAQGQAGGMYEYNLYDECPFDKNTGQYTCAGGDGYLSWLGSSAVRAALHVPEESNFFGSDNGIGFNYQPTETNLMPFIKSLAEDYEDIRVMVYNGDTDPGINVFATQNWTVALGLKETKPWSGWTVDGCRHIGGYVTRYEGDFDFVTIRGAGHMVPLYKPEASFEMIKRWIKKEEWRPYDSKCTKPAQQMVESSPRSVEALKISEIKRLKREIAEKKKRLEYLRELAGEAATEQM